MRVTAEGTCQTEETGAGGRTITAEQLESRLSAQKLELQLEADKMTHRAVEEARRQAQREIHEKHLEDMAKQVSAWPQSVKPSWWGQRHFLLTSSTYF